MGEVPDGPLLMARELTADEHEELEALLRRQAAHPMRSLIVMPGGVDIRPTDAAIVEAVAAERKRCADIAHGYFLEQGPPVAPLGSHLAIKRACGAEIAGRIREGDAADVPHVVAAEGGA